jgi:CubicO group peptidase (beta-lactamase class C family)
VNEVTGSSLEDYAMSEAFPALGINDGDFYWHSDPSGVTHAYYGLYMTPRQQIKLGLLYLQGGSVGPNARLVSSEYIRLSTTPALENDMQYQDGYR